MKKTTSRDRTTGVRCDALRRVRAQVLSIAVCGLLLVAGGCASVVMKDDLPADASKRNQPPPQTRESYQVTKEDIAAVQRVIDAMKNKPVDLADSGQVMSFLEGVGDAMASGAYAEPMFEMAVKGVRLDGLRPDETGTHRTLDVAFRVARRSLGARTHLPTAECEVNTFLSRSGKDLLAGLTVAVNAAQGVDFQQPTSLSAFLDRSESMHSACYSNNVLIEYHVTSLPLPPPQEKADAKERRPVRGSVEIPAVSGLVGAIAVRERLQKGLLPADVGVILGDGPTKMTVSAASGRRLLEAVSFVVTAAEGLDFQSSDADKALRERLEKALAAHPSSDTTRLICERQGDTLFVLPAAKQ